MNKAQAQAAIMEAVLGSVQEATQRLLGQSLTNETAEGASEAAQIFRGELTVIQAASECALRAVDAVFDKPVGVESDTDYRTRLLSVIGGASVNRVKAIKAIGLELDELGGMYDCKRR